MPDSIRIKGKGIIKYIYDATGNKLKKVTIDSTSATVKTTTTLYLLGNYMNDTLQFIGTEEGRTRPKGTSLMVYDYMIKDHLGNVRMLLTDEKDTAYYPVASMESSTLANESLYYSGLELRDTKPNDFGDHLTSPDVYAARLQANNSDFMFGPAIALKVMAGDQFNLRVSSYWNNDPPKGAPVDPFPSLLRLMSLSIGNLSSSHAQANDLYNSEIITPALQSFLNSQSYDDSKPKAYINWILLDERFNLIASSSGFQQVGGSGETTIHTFTSSPVTKNGYLYIYTSTASEDVDVYFDNLQ
ncbi:MAG: hypothetical protein IPP73_11620 [Chitinophagaceae bacterium]|nr:hypothetical protein [Chitinophagaceae bacterium]